MKNKYQGRLKDLKERLNKHLNRLTGLDKDFYSKLKKDDLIQLKTVLSDLNNVLTLKITVSAAKWICKYFKLGESHKKAIYKKIDDTKPNTNGFDILIDSPIKLVAEVKCITPINKGNRYGAAQWYAILGDALKLKNGKKECPNTKGYIKILFLIDLGNKTDEAISRLLKQSKITHNNSSREKLHKIKEDILLITKDTLKKDLKKNKIYLKTITF